MLSCISGFLLLIMHMYISSVIRHTVVLKRESEGVICDTLSNFKSLTCDVDVRLTFGMKYWHGSFCWC